MRLDALATSCSTGQLKCDGEHAETRFRLSAKRTSPFKSVGASVQSTTGSRGVRISGSNAGYTMFRGSVQGTGYPLHSTVYPFTSPSVCHCAVAFQLESTFWPLSEMLAVAPTNFSFTEDTETFQWSCPGMLHGSFPSQCVTGDWLPALNTVVEFYRIRKVRDFPL